MQGRTNVKDGIALNATVSEMEVESGNVVAGNFVEYKTFSAIEDFSEYVCSNTDSLLNKDFERVSENIYVGTYIPNYTSTSDIKLVKFENDSIQILDAYYPSAYITDYIVNNNYVYVSLGNRTVIRLKVENERFVFVDSLDLTSPASLSTAVRIDKLNIFNGYLYCIARYNASYSIVLVDFSSSLTYEKKYTFSISSGTPATCIIKNHEEYFDLVIASSVSSAQYVYKYHLDYNGSTLYKSIGNESSVSVGKLLFFYDENIISFTSYQNTLAMYYWDFDALSSRFISKNTNPYTFVSRIDDNTFIGVAKSTNNISNVTIFKINISELDLQELSTVNSLYTSYPTSLSSRAIINQNNVFVYGGATQYERLTKNSANTELSKAQDASYVKNWAGTGQPIGVAKQSGTAGDTIEVYIPSV